MIPVFIILQYQNISQSIKTPKDELTGNINQTKVMELQKLIETDGLEQGWLPHNFVG